MALDKIYSGGGEPKQIRKEKWKKEKLANLVSRTEGQLKSSLKKLE